MGMLQEFKLVTDGSIADRNVNCGKVTRIEFENETIAGVNAPAILML